MDAERVSWAKAGPPSIHGNDADIMHTDKLKRIKEQASADNVRVTVHAHQEMVEEEIALDDVLEAIESSCILEDHPEHRRGPCSLLGGYARSGRPIHVVCTSGREDLIVITVYEPKPPKWVTPTQRRL